MAVSFFDGMRKYSATADLLKRWDSNGNPTNITYNATAGKFGGPAIVATAGAGQEQLLSNTLGGTNRVLGGFWWKASTIPTAFGSSVSALIYFMDSTLVAPSGSNNFTRDASLHVISGGKLGVKFWRDSNFLGSIAAGTINFCDNVAHWIEFDFLFDTSNGHLKVRVDGASEINVSGVMTANTANPVLTAFSLNRPQGTATYTWGEGLVVYDDVDSGIAGDLRASNFPLGSCKTGVKSPNADTAQKDFSRSTGSTNFDLLDEATPNDDTDYVEASVVGNRDLYAFSALGASPTTIHLVTVNHRVANPGTGSINYKAVAKSSSTVVTGAAKAALSSYRTGQTVINRDPNTSAAWGVSGLDAANFGIEVSS